MLKKVKITASTLISSGIILAANKVSAQTIATDLPRTPLETYISAALSFAIWGAGILSVAFIIIGGFQYITAGASKEGATKGRNTLTFAIIGLIVVLLALVIRNFVLGQLSLTPPRGL